MGEQISLEHAVRTDMGIRQVPGMGAVRAEKAVLRARRVVVPAGGFEGGRLAGARLVNVEAVHTRRQAVELRLDQHPVRRFAQCDRSAAHTSELQSLMRISSDVL